MTSEEFSKAVQAIFPHLVTVSPLVESRLMEFAATVEEAEREACAKACEQVSESRRSFGLMDGFNAIMQCIDSIRARGPQ